MRGKVVDIVTDDMPFVVDSVTTEVIRHGLGLHPEMSSPVCRTALREELNRRVPPSSAHKAAG
ncbi:NAD-glutamate dehydrogenase [Geodermatophilus africanus]|uniref:NAD-glutamate dehydrogenase n=1 Tax=Geodermatophilus africanus TaxID=1137993 RepID=A0A1H3RF75_9ACTN|nr:NAD-glutamate dehydrogenase domain-containing protein [Geodermatophilus africanus]SDZ23599.1 NAD-glutamate dehydrogenase [Geodermatophilus africanus]